jgi:inorganic triphosphatase YgiF
MAAEIELKLAVPEHSLGDLEELPLLRSAIGAAKARRLDSVYFDTRKHKLRKHGISLRVRSDGVRHLQTVKSETAGRPGLTSRGEWETEVNGPSPDLAAVRHSALEPLLTKKLRRTLEPIFETRIERKQWPLRMDGTVVELAFDRGTVTTKRSSEAVSEVEIELKEGERVELFRIARKLAEAAPLRLSARSKAARGYELLAADGKPQHLSAAEVALERDFTAADAFAAIAEACLRQVAGNWEAVRSTNPEGVHEMRVGLRRLRAALSLFFDLLRDAQSQRIKKELKWLSDELGPARELHVFAERVIAHWRASHEQAYSFDRLDEKIASRRAEADARAEAAISSARFRSLLLDAAEWIEAGDWRTASDECLRAKRERPVLDLAAEILDDRTKKVLKRGKKLRKLDVRKRHKLRIAAKKLRYGAEFFVNLFPGRRPSGRLEEFLRALKTLQGCLGGLNDIAAHQQYCVSLARSDQSSEDHGELAYLAGVIAGDEEAKIASRLNSSARALDAFGELKPFWE